MRTQLRKATKTVELPDGSRGTKTAEYLVIIPESAEEAADVFGRDLWRWAVQGYLQHMRICAANALLGGNSAALKQFRSAKETLVSILGMSEEAAVKTLLEQPAFAQLRAHFEELRSGTTVRLDYSRKFPQPQWFSEPEDE